MSNVSLLTSPHRFLSRTNLSHKLLSYIGILLSALVVSTAIAAPPQPGLVTPSFFEQSVLNQPRNYACFAVQTTLAAAEADCDSTTAAYISSSSCSWEQYRVDAWTGPYGGYRYSSWPNWTAPDEDDYHVTAPQCGTVGDYGWSSYGASTITGTCPSGYLLGWGLQDAFGFAHGDQCMTIGFIKEHDTGCIHCALGAFAGDPINTSAGNKIETVTDYRGGGPFPLTFTRSYNSILALEAYSAGNYPAGENLGTGWTTGIGSHLYITTLPVSPNPCVDTQTGIVYTCSEGFTSTPVQITVWHGDGSQAWFILPSAPATIPAGTVFQNQQLGMGQLTVVNLPSPNVSTGYQYLRNDGYTELYNGSGQLLSVTNTAGLSQTYQYNTSGQLTSITDPFGRQLSFTYDSSGRISTMSNPAGGVYNYSYDANGNLASVQYPDTSVVQYKYGESSAPANALTGLIDEQGNRYATWTYNSQGQAISSTNAGNVDHVTIAYNSDGSADVTEATGLVRHLTFTEVNGTDLLATTSQPCLTCGDKAASYTYDSNGFVQSKTDFDGNVTQYTHDAFGNETSRTEAYGTHDARTITTTWNDTLNQPTLITEPGRTTGYTYDSVGHVLTKTVTDTATNVSRTTTYTYIPSGVAVGELQTVTDPLGHVTSYGYDSQGNLASVTNALHQTTSVTQYDANGMPLTIVDPNGVTTTLTYDLRQRLLTRTVAGAETQFAYDPAGNLTQVTLPTGSCLKYSYDAAHRLTGIADSASGTCGVGDSISYTLDALGNRTAENSYDPSDTLKKTLQRTYNNLNQLMTTVGGASQTTTYADDLNGNTTSIKDPLTNVTGQSFDALNRLLTVVDPESGNTTYNYDPLDRVQDVTDPKGLDTHYVYDAFGDVTSQQSPDTGTTTYTYDLDGNRLTKTDARNIEATYTYDALNRLASIAYPDASRDVIYTYDQGADGIGHLTGIQDATGTTAYSYDSHGNTTQKVVTLGSHAFTVGYQYDSADNLTGMTYPSGLQVSYGRDAAERITSVNVNNMAIVSSISYEPFGPITGFTYGNGLTETRSYDQDYRLTDIKVPGVLDWTLGDNADDDITSITDNLTSGNSQTLGYDKLNRLTSASGTYGSQSYQYDLDGNRIQQTLAGTPLTLGYDTASNKLLTVGSQAYQYDTMGDLIGDGTHSYNYDASNRLTGYDAVLTAYLYNGLGQRSVKYPVDNTAPTVTITGPAAGNVSGTVTVSASADDEFGIASVQFQLDGANFGSAVTAAPYQVSWNTTTANSGAHTLTAVAMDPAGHSTTSAGVNVTVPDTTPPTVSLTAPANGADVSGTVTVSANASDNVSVASVQFQLDGVNLGAAVTAAPYSVSWDTTTATGGSHTLTAIAEDEAGNSATSASVSVTVDNTPPTIGITAPATGNVSGTVTLTASASAAYNVAVTSVQFQLDGVNLGVQITAAPYTTTWNTINAVGSHTVTAVATDAAGNTATSAAVSVTVLDVTPPTVSMTAPATGADLTGTVTVSANASDNVAVTSVQFQLDGVNLGAPITAAPYTVTWNTATATGGSHTLTAIASDAAGNSTTSGAVSVTVDNTPPTVSLNSPASGADVAGTVSVIATANASYSVGIASVQFQLDGANLGSAVTTAPYTASWDTTTASGGSHTLTAIVKDGAGNTATSAAVSVTVDNTPPTVSINAPTVGADLAGTVTVSANASDNIAVASVQFQLDGANLSAPVTAAPYSVSWNTTTATDGGHALTAIAKDGAGNTTTSTSVSVTVDNTPPTVSISAPVNGANVSGTITVSANASDNVGVASVQFQLDGVNLGSIVNAAPYQVSWDTTTAAGGSHSLTAIAKDGAGNTTTSAVVNVTVGNNVVSLTPSSGLNFGNVNRGSSSTLTATLTNNGTGLLSILGVGTTYPFLMFSKTCGAKLAAGASCTISVKFTPTADSSYSGTLKVTDTPSGGTPTQSINLTGTGVN